MFACRKSNSLTYVNATRAVRTLGHNRGVAVVFVGGTVCKVANKRVTPAALINVGATAYPCNHSMTVRNCPLGVARVTTALRNATCIAHRTMRAIPTVHGTGGTVHGTFRGSVGNGKSGLIRVMSAYGSN